MNDTPCGCALRCYERLSKQQREKIFHGFWSTSSFDVQNGYLCGCVKVLDVKRHYTSKGTESRRNLTRVCYVRKGPVTVRVCKVAFLRIHSVSNGRLFRALQAQKKGNGAPHQDQRGRHPPGNKTDEAKISVIKSHIDSIPRYKSHYSRADNPHREYLTPDLTLTKLYSLYKEYCAEKGEHPVSDWVYRKVFNENYNLGFGR